MEIDEVDLKILSILEDDARTPFTHVAEQCGVSDATVHLRVKKMEENGIIKKYSIIVDEEKVGKSIATYILIRVDPGAVEDVCLKLIALKDVHEVYEIHERYDVLIKVTGNSLNEVREILVQNIRSIPSIAGSEAYTIYKTWKRHPKITATI